MDFLISTMAGSEKVEQRLIGLQQGKPSRSDDNRDFARYVHLSTSVNSLGMPLCISLHKTFTSKEREPWTNSKL